MTRAVGEGMRRHPPPERPQHGLMGDAAQCDDCLQTRESLDRRLEKPPTIADLLGRWLILRRNAAQNLAVS